MFNLVKIFYLCSTGRGVKYEENQKQCCSSLFCSSGVGLSGTDGSLNTWLDSTKHKYKRKSTMIVSSPQSTPCWSFYNAANFFTMTMNIMNNGLYLIFSTNEIKS